MSAAPNVRPLMTVLQPESSVETTLLDLVSAVSDECATEAEVVATVLHLLAAGRVRLCGTFRFASLQELCS